MALRLATMTDVPALNALITTSARGLSAEFYTPAQVQALITHVFGVDTQLITDRTYYVSTRQAGRRPRLGGGVDAGRSTAATR